MAKKGQKFSRYTLEEKQKIIKMVREEGYSTYCIKSNASLSLNSNLRFGNSSLNKILYKVLVKNSLVTYFVSFKNFTFIKFPKL